jgi:DNA repair protein RadC
MDQLSSPEISDGSAARRDSRRIDVPGCGYRICDLPARMRPREIIDLQGVQQAPDEVLLALLLRTGSKGANVVDVARALLARHGSLTALAASSVEDLTRVKGVGRVKAQMLKAALELGRRLTDERLPERVRVLQPGDAAGLLREQARTLEREHFWVLYLDRRNALKTRPVQVSAGLLDASLVHPREVFKAAVEHSAAAVVLVHNHPSGDPTPSAEDIRITRQLVDAGRVMDLQVLDHVVLGKPRAGTAHDFVSLRENGLVDFG